MLEKVSVDDEFNKQVLDKEEKIWRISSLTASIDDETRILVIPIPESKRRTKIADTKYTLKTNGDLAKFAN